MFNKISLKLLPYKQTIQWVRNLSAAKAAKKHDHKMQAWQIHSYGDTGELQLTPARIPHLSDPTDLLIKVNAASVNPIDAAMMHGYGKTMIDLFRRYELEFPLTLGRDFSGTIIDKGHDVSPNFHIGDNVYGIVPVHKQGSHAEVVVANESHIKMHPPHLSPVEAASILYAAMTAWSALFVTGELLVRDPQTCKVLIIGASGGVGTLALQLLKAKRAIVVGTCATDAVALVTSLGADNVLDYTSPDYINAVASEGKFNIILDCAKLGHENIPQTWSYDKFITLNSPLLVNTDKFGLIGGLAASMGDLFNANITKCASGKSVRWGFFLPSTDGLSFIDGLVKRKQIIPSIHKVYSFQELPKAYEALNAGHVRGKIVIDMQK